MPNCTIIKTGATVTSTPSERVSELKALIDAIELPLIHPYVGDAVLYDSSTDSIITVEASALTAESYPADRYTPIGVVAIPKSHNVYGDGTCGVVSLKYMNYSTPDEGSTSSQYIYWGYNSKQATSKLFTVIPTIGDFDDQSDTVTGAAYAGALPSDAFDTGLVSLCDPQAQYSTSVSGVEASPSPYVGDTGRNPLYIQTSEPSSESNAFTDFNGMGNTQMMLDNVTVSDWQTASTISNSYSSGNYPSACCCWRYHTAGTNQGDWYLPACGEIGYVSARMQTINATISSIISIYGSDAAALLGLLNHWASTEYSTSQVWLINLNNGYMSGNTNKDSSSSYVRAFLRV